MDTSQPTECPSTWGPETTSRLEARLGHRFRAPALLQQSMTHRSFQVENPAVGRGDNETLEFLGDAVLDLVIGAHLFASFPAMSEGELTKLRSALVQAQHLADVARDLGLSDFLRLGRGEEQSGGRQKPSILASAYEAVIGAVFVDSDYPTVQAIVLVHFQDRIAPALAGIQERDAKSALQELTQARCNEGPVYLLDRAEGPEHAKVFTVSVLLQGRAIASASATSKKAAEQKAAGLALAHLQETAPPSC